MFSLKYEKGIFCRAHEDIISPKSYPHQIEGEYREILKIILESEKLNLDETYKDLGNITTGKTLTHYLASDTEFKDILLKRGINLDLSQEDIQRIYNENHKKWLKELKECDVSKEEKKDEEAINRNVSPEFLEQNERRREEFFKDMPEIYHYKRKKYWFFGKEIDFYGYSTQISAVPGILIQNIKNLTFQDFCNFGKDLLSTGLYILKQISSICITVLEACIIISDVLIPAFASLAPPLSNLMYYVGYRALWKLSSAEANIYSLDISISDKKDLLLTDIADTLYQSATLIAQTGTAFLGQTIGAALATSTGAAFPAIAGALIGSLTVNRIAPIAKPVIGEYTNTIINAAKNQFKICI